MLSLARLRSAVEREFGRPVGVAFFALTALQFHLPYYMSRTLPNTLALALISLACAEWLAGSRPARTVALLTFTMVHARLRLSTFELSVPATRRVAVVSPNRFCIVDLMCWQVVQRCDMLPLAGLIGLHMLLTGQVKLHQGIAYGLVAGAGSLLLTVASDSWLWQRWLWPEGEVLWFNTVLNRCAPACPCKLKGRAWGTRRGCIMRSTQCLTLRAPLFAGAPSGASAPGTGTGRPLCPEHLRPRCRWRLLARCLIAGQHSWWAWLQHTWLFIPTCHTRRCGL